MELKNIGENDFLRQKVLEIGTLIRFYSKRVPFSSFVVVYDLSYYNWVTYQKTLIKVINQRTLICISIEMHKWITTRNSFKKPLYLGSCVPIKDYQCAVWIGLNDQEEEGQFKWENSNLPVTFSNWLPGQPDGNEHKNCVDMLQDGTWNDRYCTHNNFFVCERVWHSFIIKVFSFQWNTLFWL